ncbi:MAG: tRNA adenosine(34) deaminase TadA [Chromatocurvus sp.]
MSIENDTAYMQRALYLAEQAGNAGEVPVGAVLVLHDEVIGEGCNSVIGASDPTAHAEIIALRAGALHEGNYRLPGTTLYVTLEPCTMCLGALIHARVSTLVFAAREPRAGAVCSAARLLDSDFYNHRVTWREGVLAARSSDLLRNFFRARRETGSGVSS